MKEIFKKICLLTGLAFFVETIAGCGNTSTNLEGKVIGDYVIELPTITSIDYDAGLKKSKELFGKFGCSAVGKVLDNGDMVVGRSFDLYYSNNPAYVIRTDVEGFYKTVGVAYNTFDGKDFKTIKENGVTQDELSTLLFFTEDIMNEKGFYIEADMRPAQFSDSGIKPSTGTNLDAKVSLSFPAVVRYLGERCATVDEALELVKTLNVYGMNTGKVSWGGGFFLADQSGHYGVLELIDNKLIWCDYANCQTNYYINDEYKDRASNGNGLGRYELLTSKIDGVKSEKDMKELMKDVRYSQFFTPYESKFNVVSEACGEGELYKDIGGKLTLDMCRSHEYDEQVLAILEEMKSKERVKSIQQLKDEQTEWLSVWQTVANCNKKTISFTFYEDDTLTFDYTI